MIVSVAYLNKRLSYDPETGILVWLQRNREASESEHVTRRWNTRYAGRPAGYKSKLGYIQVRLSGKFYWAHRIAFAIHHGRWPEFEIDHINHVRDDNRISNLREVSRLENCKNASLSRANTSGYAGVIWSNQVKKWQVKVYVDGKQKHFGNYEDKSLAAQAAREAMRKNGYHKNHGR